MLDRQIFGFSTNEIYQWLMDTPPQSTVMEQKLRERTDPELASYLYQSPDTTADEAEEIRERRRQLLRDLEKFDGGS